MIYYLIKNIINLIITEFYILISLEFKQICLRIIFYIIFIYCGSQVLSCYDNFYYDSMILNRKLLLKHIEELKFFTNKRINAIFNNNNNINDTKILEKRINNLNFYLFAKKNNNTLEKKFFLMSVNLFSQFQGFLKKKQNTSDRIYYQLDIDNNKEPFMTANNFFEYIIESLLNDNNNKKIFNEIQKKAKERLFKEQQQYLKINIDNEQKDNQFETKTSNYLMQYIIDNSNLFDLSENVENNVDKIIEENQTKFLLRIDIGYIDEVKNAINIFIKNKEIDHNIDLEIFYFLIIYMDFHIFINILLTYIKLGESNINKLINKKLKQKSMLSEQYFFGNFLEIYKKISITLYNVYVVIGGKEEIENDLEQIIFKLSNYYNLHSFFTIKNIYKYCIKYVLYLFINVYIYDNLDNEQKLINAKNFIIKIFFLCIHKVNLFFNNIIKKIN
jgi:hypothetical protein